MMVQRVVVTGMGAVTPLGVTVDRFWHRLIEGQSGVGPITLFDAAEFPVRIGAECSDFDAESRLDRRLVKRVDRCTAFALAAADEAMKQAGLQPGQFDPARGASIVGSGIGGMTELLEQHIRLLEKGPTKVSAFAIPKLMINAASGNISIQFGLRGMSVSVASACASATNAMGEAVKLIRGGGADFVVTGGTEAAMTTLAIAAFGSMKALSTRNDEPTKASRPFDRDRDGFVLGEGSGMLVFESLDHARKRGATILAEILGFGASSDAGHITQPDPQGLGAAAAMQAALDDANLSPDKVDYINAHATATPLGDIAEVGAIKRVFSDHARKLIISSTKSSMGHLLGASGGVELIASICAVRNSIVPPTINLDNPDEGCDLDCCPHKARDRDVKIALSNSFGFGGHNACVIAGRYSD